MFDDNKMKTARKPGKKQKENSVGCTGEAKTLTGNNIRVGSEVTLVGLALKLVGFLISNITFAYD